MQQEPEESEKPKITWVGVYRFAVAIGMGCLPFIWSLVGDTNRVVNESNARLVKVETRMDNIESQVLKNTDYIRSSTMNEQKEHSILRQEMQAQFDTYIMPLYVVKK